MVAENGAVAAVAPAADASCVVSAGNRSAPLAPDGTYTIYNIPGNTGAIRARATCSDGSIGQSAVGFTNPLQADTIELGPIEWGRLDPVPLAVALTAPSVHLASGESSQLKLTSVALDGTTRDVTARSEGTTYSISNTLLASISENGLAKVLAAFAPGSSARFIVGATAEGSVSSTFQYVVGPVGQLNGEVRRAGGGAAVANAQVSVVRLQPMEQAVTAVTDSTGHFSLAGVSAGRFLVIAVDPATGDRAQGGAQIENEGQVASVVLTMNGQGTVDVTVVDAAGAPKAGAEVTFTALEAIRDTRTLTTNASGHAVFSGVPAGEFTVSTRDPATRLVGTAVARLAVGETMPLTLRLQPIGTIAGVVKGVDGATLQTGVQVRILSRERGLLTQQVTAEDGAFQFDTLPISDGPFTLDAFVDGRLRARVPGIVISQPNQAVHKDIVFSAVGVVAGRVTNVQGQPFANARVTLQSLEGLRLTFDARTDSEGYYLVPAVPVGNFDVTVVTETGRNGNAHGRVKADGDRITVDVVIASNGLVGTVYARDGSTPVPGATVYLAPRSLGMRYSYAGFIQASSTTTDALGRFGFSVDRPDAYYVQAEKDLERGRSEAVIVNMNPGQPLVANIAFLAKGSVWGVVTDPNGNVQANVPVRIRTEGAFTADREATTDAQGRYAIDGVFVGDVIASARNDVTHLAGFSRNRLDEEGQALRLDLVLAGTGVVQGRVLARDGAVVSTPVRLSLRSRGVALYDVDLPNGSTYRFEGVPIGDVEIEAEKLENGDRGVATTRIEAANEARSLDVRLVGQGSVHVKVVDTNGASVAGARVAVSTSRPFVSSKTLETDATGYVVFEPVYAGDVSVSVTKPDPMGALSGAAFLTLLPNEDGLTVVTLSLRPVGRVHGTVFTPNGTTPSSEGLWLHMTPEPSPGAFLVQADAQGRFAFEQVPAGTYAIDAVRFYNRAGCPVSDRVRGRASNVVLQQSGEDVATSIQLIGQGSVSGRVTLTDGSGTSGITVQLTNPDPIYGVNVTCNRSTTYDTVTDGAGMYLLPDVPPGNFTLTAENTLRTLRAEGRGIVRFDGDASVVDLALVDSAVTLPYTLYDANGFKFDVAGNGSVSTGTNNVFAGLGPDSAGMRLEVVKDGVALPFTNGNGTIGRLTKNAQQLDIDEENAFGLRVTREIYTPRSGYFTRYIETLENRGTAPVTVQMRATSFHKESNSNPRVVDTSDGDQVLSVLDPLQRDRWAVIDDQDDADPFSGASIPATGHLFDGTGASAQVGAASYTLIGQTGKLSYQWNDLTVPPAGKVAVMHFVFHQISRYSAREAALRLAQLPPEAIDDLTTDERQRIVNFAIPDASAVSPLPNLDAGRITGTVYSGDGTTPVAGARVSFKSRHALFGRARFATSDSQGQFEFRSRLDGTINNAVIPVHAFELSAVHLLSGAGTAVSQGDFAVGETSTEQGLVFFNTGNIRGSVKRHNDALVADATVLLCRRNDRCFPGAPDFVNQTVSEADGRFTLLANPPGDFYLFADKAHPQGAPILGDTPVRVTAGDTTTRDVSMEPTGSIAGIVRAPDGTPVVGAEVRLAHGSRQRAMHSDTAGHYRFYDVPVGASTLLAIDTISGATGTASADVQVNLETERDIQLSASGTITVHVEFARGLTAANASVFVSSIGNAQADANGVARFQVPQGTYTITAYHPDFSSAATRGSATATVTQSGQLVDVTVRLGPAGVVKGTIVRPDGTTLASGFPYKITPASGPSEARSGNTQPNGMYRVGGVSVGTGWITAYDPQQHRFADAEFAITEDGQEVTVDLVLRDNRIALPATLKDANRFAYDVQRSGALKVGSGAYADAGLALEIDGQPVLGDSSALLEADGRQFTIEQPSPMSGLEVTRKIHVPRGAYYARYLDVLRNPTASPITVAVALTNRFAGGQVVATSNGDGAVDAADRWYLVDDGVDDDILLVGGQPVSAHVFQGAAAPLLPSIVEFAMDGTRPRIAERWNSVVVPAGGRIALLHFAVQQINRNGAVFAAQRLERLPPEALAEMDSADAAVVVNFAMPSDLASTVEPLPSLTGSVQGINDEGNGLTPVRGTAMTVQSTHPLFNRVWGKVRDPMPFCPPGTSVASLRTLASIPPGANPPALGSFGLQGQLTSEDSIVLPVGVDTVVRAQVPTPCFGWYAGHPLTQVPSRVETLQPPATRDVLFDTGVFTGTVVGAGDFQITQGRVYRSIDDPDALIRPVYVPVASDGTYVFPGVPAGTFDLLFDTTHPQAVGGDGMLRAGRILQPISVGQVLDADLLLQPTGQIQGTAMTVNAEASVNALISLSGEKAGQTYDPCASGCSPEALQQHKGMRDVRREVRTDSLGRFAFGAVPAGSYTLSAIDPISLARVTTTVVVAEGQVANKNLTYLPLGSINVAVQTAAGTPAADAYVYITAAAIPGGERLAGHTDPAGHLTIANVPKGTYVLRVIDPRHSTDRTMDRTFNGEVIQQGQVDTAQIVLGIRATVSIKVVDAAASDAPLANAQVRYQPNGTGSPLSLGSTDLSGRVHPVVWNGGNYLVQVDASDGRRVQQMIVIGIPEDALTVEPVIRVGLNPEQTGTFSFSGETHLYGVFVQPGDRLAVTVSGAQVGSVPPNSRIRATVLDPGRWQAASGYGDGSSGNYAQHNLSGDLQNILIANAGFHTIVVQPYLPQSFDLPAGYRLVATINGQPASILPYQGGGTVTGRLLLPDGITPVAGSPVRLSRTSNPAMLVERVTDASGTFVFDAVPTGTFEVEAIASPATSNRVVKRTGTLSTGGEIAVVDLQLPDATTIDVTVTRSDGSAPDHAVSVTFRSASGTESGWTDVSGRLTRTVVSKTTIVVNANDALGSAETTVEPADGQTIATTLRLGGGQVRGRVLDASGAGVAGLSVSGRRHGFTALEFGSRMTDVQGGFDFGELPGGADVELLVHDPVDYGLYVKRFAVIAGQINEQDIVLDGRGVLHGIVRNSWGAPIGDAVVEAVFARSGSAVITSQTTTATDGSYHFSDLPNGRVITLSAKKLTGFSDPEGGYVSLPVQATIPANGAQVQADMTIALPGGRVTVILREIPGVTWCEVRIGDAYQIHDCSVPFVFDGVPPGVVTVVANESNDGPVRPIGTTTALVVEGANIVVTLGPSLVRGHVTYSDGYPAMGIVVELRDASGSVKSTETDGDGEYKISGAALGAFSVSATDSASLLSASASGVLVDESTAVTVDMVLPPHASLSGTVYDAGGQTVAGAPVFVERAAASVAAEAVSDAGGGYQFDRIAAGDLFVSALHPVTQNVASATVVATAGQTSSVDLHFPLTGSVSGEVRQSDGTLLADACVKLWPLVEGAAFRSVLVETVTDAFGQYLFPAVLPTPVRMAAGVCGTSGSDVGLAERTVSSSTNVVANLQTGTAVWLPTWFSEVDGDEVAIQGNGTLNKGESGYDLEFAEDFAARIEINGKTFPAQPAASFAPGDQVDFGAMPIGPLAVSRRIYSAGNYLRYLETISNPSSQAVTATVKIVYKKASGAASLVVSPETTGGRYGLQAGGVFRSRLAGYAFAGSGNVECPVVLAADGNPLFEWTWTVTLGPGQRVAYLHYLKTLTQWTSDTDLRGLMQRLSDMTEPGQFDGLDAQERAAIRNFAVPPP
jgi:hypothetical protein